MSTGYELFIRVKVVRVERSWSLVQAQTLFIPVAIKNLVKIVKYIEFLAKVHSNIASNVVRNCLRQNYVISSLCAV